MIGLPLVGPNDIRIDSALKSDSCGNVRIPVMWAGVGAKRRWFAFYSSQKLHAELVRNKMRIPVMWAADYGDVGQSRSEATLVVFLH